MLLRQIRLNPHSVIDSLGSVKLYASVSLSLKKEDGARIIPRGVAARTQ